MVNKRTLVDERFRNLLRGWDGSYATEGPRGSARGFNPENRSINGSALKGRKLTLDQSHTYRSSKRIPCLFSSVLPWRVHKEYGHHLPHRRPEAGHTPSPARAGQI